MHRLDGVDASRAPRWKPGREYRHAEKSARCQHERERVRRADLKQKRRQGTAERECRHETERGADRDDAERRGEDIA